MNHPTIERVAVLYELYDVAEYMNQHRTTYEEECEIISAALAAVIGYGLPEELFIGLENRDGVLDYFHYEELADWKSDLVSDLIDRFGRKFQFLIYDLTNRLGNAAIINKLTFHQGKLLVDCTINHDEYLASRLNYYGIQ